MSCSVCAGHDSAKCPCCGEGGRMKECPECHGTGKTTWLAWDDNKNEAVEVSREVWMELPEDCPGGLSQYEEGGYQCPHCYGEGRISEED